MAGLFDVSFLTALIESGVRIVTPNKRLAAKIQQAHGAKMRNQGQSVWAPASVISADQWLSEAWELAQDQGEAWTCEAIVSTVQRRQLFHQVVKGNSDDVMMGVTQLAGHADAAYRNLEQWELSVDAVPKENIGSQKFTDWAETFAQQLAAHELITREESYKRLADAFNRGELPREAQLALVGFDQISPLLKRVCHAAAEQVSFVEIPAVGDCASRTIEKTRDAEIAAAAAWAHQILQEDPKASIGIIIPELGTCRDQVERIFSETFEPQYLLPTTNRYALPFNFSAGTPLASTAVVQDALAILGLGQKSWDLEQACAFLHSPFWGDYEGSLVQRATLERMLRRLAKPSIRVAEMRFWAKRAAEKAAVEDTLHYRLEAVEAERRQQRGTLKPSVWAERFIHNLTLMGWPGSRRPDSIEHQQIVSWYQALEIFSTLDSVVMGFNELEAIQHLKQILSGIPFQPKTANGPIQILGALEGAGLQFTHCWVMAMSRSAWPPAPAPNPLLPTTYQREHLMPRCDAARELELAKKLTANFAGCANQVIFSSPEQVDGNTEFASSLITGFPVQDTEGKASTSVKGVEAYREALLAKRCLDAVRDTNGPPLEAGKAKGGSGILRAQAACPFNAFAEHRLGAETREEPHAGLTPMDRGNLLHNALADVWTAWGSQAGLLAHDDAAIASQVGQAVDNALAQLQQFKPDVMGDRFRALEQTRIVADILRLVEIDQQRPPFTVTEIEQASECTIGPLTLSVRLDRNDWVEGVGQLIIDYKTGKSSAAQQWQSDRPEEPQLPLYAVTADVPPAGVAFAVCNAVKTDYRGVGAEGLSVKGISVAGTNRYLDLPDTWEGILSQWNNVLVSLAEEYNEGYAAITFGSKKALEYSKDMLPLNRHSELETLQTLGFA